MQGTVDMSRYLEFLVSMIPETGMVMPELPAAGRMKFRMDVNKGQLSTMMTIPMDGISSLMAYSQQMAVAVESGAIARDEPRQRSRDRERIRISEPEEVSAAPPEEAPPLDPALDPAYWFDKGGLLSTYGNDKAAIPAYKKAIELDPSRSEAHFNLGVSYGEVGEYELAVASINKAIELNPSKDLYYYGRARVYLLANDIDKALEDFKRAAAEGNVDAQEYLRHEGIE
jgi:tetratricopeptide (TPR) repeat protein